MGLQLLLKIFLALFISISVFAAPTDFDKKFNTLEKGMTTKAVKTLLGAPDLREAKGTGETWHYEGRQVIFDNGKVSEFGKEGPQVAATPTPEPTTVPHTLGIGDTCKKDVECQSENCYFKKCSGKNNCSVPFGKLCATDSDCCDGKCDFQKCKKR
jgi:hypothetical protein